MAIHLDLTSPSGSSSLPEGRASNSIAFCLALLPMRLAMRLLLPVARWSLAPPFHPYRPEGRRSVLCCAISQVTWADVIRHRALWAGSSSATKWPRPSRGLASDCSKGCDCLQWWLEEAPCGETGALARHMRLRREQSVPTRGKRRRFSTNRGKRGRVLPILARTRLQYESYPNGSSRSVRI